MRVAEGQSAPCDSGDDHLIIAGKFAPGQVVRASTFESCVCVQQTFEPFTDTDWSGAGWVCRAQICTGYGKAKRCVEAPDPTIVIKIDSKRLE